MKTRDRGFIVIEVLIAGLILTAAIAATMYLFRNGLETLAKVRDSNVVSGAVPAAVNHIKSSDSAIVKSTVTLPDGVLLTMKWVLVTEGNPTVLANVSMNYWIALYKVSFVLSYGSVERDYEINVFRYKKKTDGPFIM